MLELLNKLLVNLGLARPKRRARHVEYVPCPHCGETIRSDAKSCRHCGSDDDTGWSEDADTYGVIDSYEIDDDEYADIVHREFPGHNSTGQPGFSAVWKITAIVLLAIMIWSIMTQLGP